MANRLLRGALILLTVTLFILPGCAQSTPQASVTAHSPLVKQWSSPPPMTININKEYTAIVDTTLGKFTIRLLPKEAPLAVNNFVFLSRQGFYNGVKFHRIIKNFVIQTGDPLGNGTGGPGYTFNDEKVTRDYRPGTVAMANAGPNTNGSQFFICLTDLSTRLPKNYTIFGEVTDGMDVVFKIAETPVTLSPAGEMSLPLMDVRVKSITILEK